MCEETLPFKQNTSYLWKYSCGAGFWGSHSHVIAWVYSYIQICCRLLETRNKVGSFTWRTAEWTGMQTLEKKKWIKCKQSHFARVTRTQPCTAQTLAIQQILRKWLSPGYLTCSFKPTWIAFPVNDITVDENAWTLVHRANLSVAHPYRA